LAVSPEQAIAAGAALIAIAQFTKASLKKSSQAFPKGAGGGGPAGVAAQYLGSKPLNEAQDLKVSGEVVIRGQDLWVVLSNYQKSNKFLKVNG